MFYLEINMQFIFSSNKYYLLFDSFMMHAAIKISNHIKLFVAT